MGRTPQIRTDVIIGTAAEQQRHLHFRLSSSDLRPSTRDVCFAIIIRVTYREGVALRLLLRYRPTMIAQLWVL
jgi:hypothetical protein